MGAILASACSDLCFHHAEAVVLWGGIQGTASRNSGCPWAESWVRPAGILGAASRNPGCPWADSKVRLGGILAAAGRNPGCSKSGSRLPLVASSQPCRPRSRFAHQRLDCTRRGLSCFDSPHTQRNRCHCIGAPSPPAFPPSGCLGCPQRPRVAGMVAGCCLLGRQHATTLPRTTGRAYVARTTLHAS